MHKLLFLFLIFVCCTPAKKTSTVTETVLPEKHRPLIHFTPPANWMNDPNGMVYHNGIYHLFYQYHPHSTVWGPMHWGHATSKDLVHWNHEPIALYPDSLGYIFSGSAVADSNNTSGFGKDGKIPLVAIFTHHDPKGEKAGRNNFQYQSIAYSLDDGKSWTKYSGNPVLRNPGIRDFRDPKVMWYEPTKEWIMTLATLDRITFYSSSNLTDWTKESEFGKEVGAHGGVWECPDLFPLKYNGNEHWVLLVSINPGGPNGGSATQYFVGQFNGKDFSAYDTATRWIDYGPDNYAGVTWSGTGERKIFMGWMSNWQYANLVPTEKWRSAMTVPRDLHLQKVNDKFYVASLPARQLMNISEDPQLFEDREEANFDLAPAIGKLIDPVFIFFFAQTNESFSISISNRLGQNVLIGYDVNNNHYYIDRSNSGNVTFEKGFGTRHTAPRISNKEPSVIALIIDNSSVELFADEGLTVMTEIFFPDQPFTDVKIESSGKFQIKKVQVMRLKSTGK